MKLDKNIIKKKQNRKMINENHPRRGTNMNCVFCDTEN